MFFALLLIFSDTKHWLHIARSSLSVIVSPVQYAVNLPSDIANWLHSNTLSTKQLLNENEKLKAQQLLFNVALQKLKYLEQENTELRTLLHAAQESQSKIIMAKLLAVDSGQFSRQAVLNRGTSAGVFLGQSVVDAYGIIGQVVTVDLFNSRVLFLTDPKSAIPAINVRTGMQVIAIGTGNDLELLHIPDTADVGVGDTLVTSGLASNLPAGYAVGVVTSVTHVPGERFMVVKVKPSAHVNSSRYVLLIAGRNQDETIDKKP